MLKGLGKKNGYFTLEAALVMSGLFIALFVVLFSFLVIYQKVFLDQAAARGAERTAHLWTQDNQKPYERLAGEFLYQQAVKETAEGRVSPQTAAKLRQAEEEIKAGLGGLIQKPLDTKVRVYFSNNVLTRKVEVEITQEIRIPFGGLKSFFDGRSELVLTGRGVAEVTEPAEYIRNIDFIWEYGERLAERIDSGEGL